MKILFIVCMNVPEYKHSALNRDIFTFATVRLEGNNALVIESITGMIIYLLCNCDTARVGAET